jgi:hypothetical protein
MEPKAKLGAQDGQGEIQFAIARRPGGGDEAGHWACDTPR